MVGRKFMVSFWGPALYWGIMLISGSVATISQRFLTLPETNVAPETLGLEDGFSFGTASLQVLC